jgi:hypothetical protein
VDRSDVVCPEPSSEVGLHNSVRVGGGELSVLTAELGLGDGGPCKCSVVVAIRGVPRASDVTTGEAHADSKGLHKVTVDEVTKRAGEGHVQREKAADLSRPGSAARQLNHPNVLLVLRLANVTWIVGHLREDDLPRELLNPATARKLESSSMESMQLSRPSGVMWSWAALVAV